MAIKKVVKKTGGGLRARPGMGGATETSPNRPYHVEKLAPCGNGCPNETKIREILTTLALAEKHEMSPDDAFREAWQILIEKKPLPAVCGRVYPHPCEAECNRKEKDGAVAINNVERLIGDFALDKGFVLPKISDTARPQKIAVIGSGPAGLSCAHQLARRGYPVTVFEAFPKPGGIKTDERGQLGGTVFAGGDDLELGLVTIAIYQGRRAAETIHEHFTGEKPPARPQQEPIRHDKVMLQYYESKLRNDEFHIPVAERFTNPDREIMVGLTTEQAIAEAKRCMSCGSCFECGNCWNYCQDSAVVKPLLKGQQYKFKLELCKGCNKCAENCPCGYIEMHDPVSYAPPQPVG